MIIMLSDCVAYVESRNNPYAMRYEPRYSPAPESVQPILDYATGGYLSADTVEMIGRTSWGMYQIMGDNLYTSANWRSGLVHFLADMSGQYEAFQTFLQTIGFSDRPFAQMLASEVDLFAVKYNGSETYADSLVAAYRALKAE